MSNSQTTSNQTTSLRACRSRTDDLVGVFTKSGEVAIWNNKPVDHSYTPRPGSKAAKELEQPKGQLVEETDTVRNPPPANDQTTGKAGSVWGAWFKKAVEDEQSGSDDEDDDDVIYFGQRGGRA